MIHELPDLPWGKDALAPFISAETVEFHHGKHHAAYVKNLNDLIQGTEYADMPLEQIIKTADGPIFNNAAQVWNHTFFWECMSPGGGGEPSGKLMELIKQNFGSFESFKDDFSTSAAKLFGSGWTWLALNRSGMLEILPLSNAETPLRQDKTALVTLDVWEHAYYIDYRNARPKFIEGFWDVVNWEFAAQQMD